ncbi:MAG: PAS domain S-box protein [Candidatus Wallbacteria bacterium]|nr:PAS domain S-box protein [Candidatus Wallbacteria bacterium]
MSEESKNIRIERLLSAKTVLISSTVLIFFVLLSHLGIQSMRLKNQEFEHQLASQNLSANMLNVVFKRMGKVADAVADSQQVKDFLSGGSAEIQTTLDTTMKILSADIVYLMDSNGNVIACTFYGSNETLTGNNYAFRPYFSEAITGTPQIFPALGVTTRKRGVYFSAPVYILNSFTPAGVVVIKMGSDMIDELLLQYQYKCAVTSPSSVVFSTNFDEWLFKFVPPVDEKKIQEIDETKQFAGKQISLAPFHMLKKETVIDGKLFFVAHAPIGSSKWTIISLTPKNFSYPLSSQQKSFLAWSGLMILLLFLIITILIAHLLWRKKTMLELKESEEKYRLLFASESNTIILLDAETRHVADVNDKACALYGYTREEFLHLKSTDFAGEMETTFAGSDKMTSISSEIIPYRYHRRKDGTLFSVEISYGSFSWRSRKMLCVLVRDVTEQKKMVESLQDSERKFRTLYESSSDAIMLLNEEGFFDCNLATLKIFGCNRSEEFLHRQPHQFSPLRQPDGSDSTEAARRHIKKAFAEGSDKFEWLHCRKDGSTFPAEVWLTAMEVGGKKVVQAVVRDISEHLKSLESLSGTAQDETLS